MQLAVYTLSDFVPLNSLRRIPWQSKGQDSALPQQGAQVGSLVSELRSYVLCGRAKKKKKYSIVFTVLAVSFAESVQSLSHVQLFVTPWTAARQASLSITNSRSLLKLLSIESVMPSNHLILCRPLLLPPSILPSIRVFSNESVLCIRWPKYWSFSFNISPSNEYSGLNSCRNTTAFAEYYSC